MEYHTCDICGIVLTKDKYALTLISDNDVQRISRRVFRPQEIEESTIPGYNPEAYNLEETSKCYEICPGCKKLVIDIFEFRKQGMKRLVETLEQNYGLEYKPRKENKK